MIRKLRIRTLRAQVAQCKHICESLAEQFESETLTTEQKAALARRWDETLKESHALQVTLDSLEKLQKRANGDGSQISED